MAGKVLVACQEHIDRLVAARLQADIMATETFIVARTDAEAATLLDNNVDVRDHPFILGSTNPNQQGLNDEINAAEKRGASQAELIDITSRWDSKAGLCKYGDAVCKVNDTHSMRLRGCARQAAPALLCWDSIRAFPVCLALVAGP